MKEIGGKFSEALEPYAVLVSELVDIGGDVLDGMSEAEPNAEHAVALIAARIATEASAAVHLVRLGYPVQAFTIVGSMLELMHTAAYIGGDNSRAREYFTHTDSGRAYPGSVKKAISAVGKQLGLPTRVVDREYTDFYNQMCMVKHGNPMAMSLGVTREDNTLYIHIGPVFTPASTRLGFATMQHAVRYLLLVLTIFIRHHASDESKQGLLDRITAVTDRWQFLNAEASKALDQIR